MNSASFHNPFSEGSRTLKASEPCILVIFGATGDLTARKLIPALYHLAKEGLLPLQFACVGFARRNKDDKIFRKEMKEAVKLHSQSKSFDDLLWETFSEKLFYHKSEFDNDDGYQGLNKKLKELDKEFKTKGNRIYYLATQPSFFTSIIRKLDKHSLIYKPIEEKWSRVIIEKPFGNDLESAKNLQNDISKNLSEDQIYRIDHYLGKETVQNLLVFRFANALFEAVWNRKYIDHVQITVAEDIGIGSRGRFWEETGLLRDMIQNHMMQLLSLVAMEPPVSLSAEAIRDEKVKVLKSIKPIDINHIIRGQYDEGFINGEDVKAYRQENNVQPNSDAETYVALKLYINNWRWADVPFYLRSGKRLPKRVTEIAVVFRNVPGFLFQKKDDLNEKNILAIRIQPDEGISLRINCKVPTMTNSSQPVKMDFRYGSYFGLLPPEAYERLICDCMLGDSTLFARNDEVLTSWKLLTPILKRWGTDKDSLILYPAGTWGPTTSEDMINTKARRWRLI